MTGRPSLVPTCVARIELDEQTELRVDVVARRRSLCVRSRMYHRTKSGGSIPGRGFTLPAHAIEEYMRVLADSLPLINAHQEEPSP